MDGGGEYVAVVRMGHMTDWVVDCDRLGGWIVVRTAEMREVKADDRLPSPGAHKQKLLSNSSLHSASSPTVPMIHPIASTAITSPLIFSRQRGLGEIASCYKDPKMSSIASRFFFFFLASFDGFFEVCFGFAEVTVTARTGSDMKVITDSVDRGPMAEVSWFSCSHSEAIVSEERLGIPCS